MGQRYTTKTATGYNATPPPDDGSAVAGNVVEWQKHLDKIGDPIKNLADAINSALVDHFSNSEAEKTTSYNAATTDFNKVIEMDVASGTFTLPPLASSGLGWYVTVKNVNATDLTIDGNGAETIDGSASITIGENQSVTLMVNNAEDDWMVVGSGNPFPSGTTMGFYQSSAPEGWTQVTGFVTDSVLMVSNNTGGTGSNNTWAINGLTAAVSGTFNHSHGPGTLGANASSGAFSNSKTPASNTSSNNGSVSFNSAVSLNTGNTGNPNSANFNANGGVTHNSSNWRPPALRFIICTAN